jgi:hypothetical protein
MLAAMGQSDIERRRRGNRIIKKQFVKIAHAIEQKRVGMRLLDLKILRHHRGRLRRLLGGDPDLAFSGLMRRLTWRPV